MEAKPSHQTLTVLDTLNEAGEKIKQEFEKRNPGKKIDVGFRVLRLDSSNYDKEGRPKKERTALDRLFDDMLQLGLTLDAPLRTVTVDGCAIHIVNGGDFVACYDEVLTDEAVRFMSMLEPLFVSTVEMEDNGPNDALVDKHFPGNALLDETSLQGFREEGKEGEKAEGK